MEPSISVNLMNHNQMAVHALSGCTKAADSQQTGTNGSGNCTDGAGCTVLETNLNSAGAAFATAQGGTWATQFDVSGAPRLDLLISDCVDLRRRNLVGRTLFLARSGTHHPSPLKHQYLVLERESNFLPNRNLCLTLSPSVPIYPLTCRTPGLLLIRPDGAPPLLHTHLRLATFLSSSQRRRLAVCLPVFITRTNPHFSLSLTSLSAVTGLVFRRFTTRLAAVERPDFA